MKQSNRTLRFIYLIALVMISLIVINVFLVTVFKVHIRSGVSLDYYISNASSVRETIFADRGNIYDANGQVIAHNQRTYDIICYLDSSRKGNGNTPAYIDDPVYTSTVLSMYLDMEPDEIYYFLTAHPDWYQTELGIKGRNLSAETRDAILNHEGIHGIGFKESSKRLYPQGGDIAPYLVGYAQNDNTTGEMVGKMGVEKYLNDELNGTDGSHFYQMSKRGYILPGMYEEYVPAEDGYDVYLTLDTSIQQALETSFDDIVTVNNASQAWGGVVEIKTGKILAWGQTPSFDPNVLDVENWTNIGSQYPYEPGSVFKSIIYAAAIDLGVYDGDTTFNSETYCYSWNGTTPYRVYPGSGKYNSNYCITNAAGKSWGQIPLDYGLIYSSNVATMTLLEQYVGTQNYMDYVTKFGFFKEVDSDGIEEVTGVRNFNYPSEKLSMTYGQGSSVTMLQLLQAYTAIFGNGEMVKPYFIDKVVNPDTGEIVYEGQRKVVSTPIKQETAKKLQGLLERVVSDPAGTAKYYAIDETNIIAKTGTSEISIGGRYNANDSISSVMMAFPADNPQYMIYYAYISPYDYYNHLNSTVIKELTRKVAILTNVKVNEDVNTTSTYEKYITPDLSNKTLQESLEELKKYNLKVEVIGDGINVINQYPNKGDAIYSGNKVFLLTDGGQISLPDFKGWSRKEIVAYHSLSNLNIIINGYGVVYEQSISPSSIVTSRDELVLYLYDINTDLKENIPEVKE